MIDFKDKFAGYHPISIKKKNFVIIVVFGEIYLMVKEKYLLTTQKKNETRGEEDHYKLEFIW